MSCFKVKILASSKFIDSTIITMELTYPRFIHSEFMTHRQFSRNAASSRAIPISKMIKDVVENPVIPINWGKNQKGMQAGEEAGKDIQLFCEGTWLQARDLSVGKVKLLDSVGIHKQIVNRLLEPWMWITVIATGNKGAWNNFFALRCHPEAEPHIQKIAYMAREEIRKDIPKQLNKLEWHLPLIGFDGDENLSDEDKIKVSVGRVARVSYLTHEGIRDVGKDIDLHDRLMESKHFSPFEHIAKAGSIGGFGGNLGNNWVQYRKIIPGEYRPDELNN
jgi:thymidylate synthase ThyX